jgi:hypothetical protein
MKSKEVALKWECKERWVRERCCEGMVPLAEKHGRNWYIPEEAEKPICTRHYAVDLLMKAKELQNGVDVEIFNGKNNEKIMASYRYMSRNAFISRLKFENEDECIMELKESTITQQGNELMEKDNGKVKFKAKEVTVGGGINAGIASASIQAKYS